MPSSVWNMDPRVMVNLGSRATSASHVDRMISNTIERDPGLV